MFRQTYKYWPKQIVSSITSLDKDWRSLWTILKGHFFRTDYCSTYYCIPRLYNSIYNGLCSKKKSVRGPTSTYNFSQSVELLNSICSRDQSSWNNFWKKRWWLCTYLNVFVKKKNQFQIPYLIYVKEFTLTINSIKY